MGFIIEKGSGSFYGYLCPEKTSHFVLIGIVVESSTWQMEVAFGTDSFFGGRQSMSADDTEPWGNQIE